MRRGPPAGFNPENNALEFGVARVVVQPLLQIAKQRLAVLSEGLAAFLVSDAMDQEDADFTNWSIFALRDLTRAAKRALDTESAYIGKSDVVSYFHESFHILQISDASLLLTLSEVNITQFLTAAATEPSLVPLLPVFNSQ